MNQWHPQRFLLLEWPDGATEDLRAGTLKPKARSEFQGFDYTVEVYRLVKSYVNIER